MLGAFVIVDMRKPNTRFEYKRQPDVDRGPQDDINSVNGISSLHVSL
jgi:hypothetical protein